MSHQPGFDPFPFPFHLLQRRGYESLDAVRAQAGARALFTVLKARRLSVSAENCRRILAVRDPDQLDRWVARAVTATSTKAALAAPKPRQQRARGAPARSATARSKQRASASPARQRRSDQ